MSKADLSIAGLIKGEKYILDIYFKPDFSGLEKYDQVCGLVCDKDGKLLIVSPDNKTWFFPGGRLETGESAEATVVREIYEESAAVVVPDSLRPFYYQKVYKQTPAGKVFETIQLRFTGVIDHMEEFTGDPDQGNMKFQKLIAVADLKSYIDWSELTDRIVSRLGETFPA